jgi:hypothetical protein
VFPVALTAAGMTTPAGVLTGQWDASWDGPRDGDQQRLSVC